MQEGIPPNRAADALHDVDHFAADQGDAFPVSLR